MTKNPNRADHRRHTYLIPECRECNSPEAIARRRAERQQRSAAR